MNKLVADGPMGLILNGLDRLPALACHVAFAFLVVMAFRISRRYLWIAIVAHFVLDFTVFSVQRSVSGYLFEAIFFLFGGLALAFIANAIKKKTIPVEPDEPAPDPKPVRRKG